MEATFCFVDLAGFSALTEAHGDDAAADLVRRFTELVRTAIGTSGRLVKTIGDAAFVVLPSPALGVAFIERLCGMVARERDFPILRAGLHHGDAVEREGDVFGAAVNLTARVTAQARGGQVLGTARLSEAARAVGMAVSPLGPVRLHNLHDPVELFSIDVEGGGLDVIDPVCRMRVDPERAAGCLRVHDAPYWFCSLRCVALFAERPETYVS
jgi:class 3 adenylate cyclase/YHS domain-containing protein